MLVKRPPSKQFTYGLRGSSILAALFNAIFLLMAVGAIAWEAIQRLAARNRWRARLSMIVAAIGIAVNGLTAWLFASGAKDDINIRGAFLHMAADATVSVGVVLAGTAILYTGWLWLAEFVVSVIVAVIVWAPGACFVTVWRCR